MKLTLPKTNQIWKSSFKDDNRGLAYTIMSCFQDKTIYSYFNINDEKLWPDAIYSNDIPNYWSFFMHLMQSNKMRIG